MINSSYTRTTISIPEELLFEVKKRALLEKKTITEVIKEGLSIYLGKNYPSKTISDINSLFGIWGKGPSGLSFLKKTRYGKTEKIRERRLNKLWKKF